MEQVTLFRQLHHQDRPLLIGNVWDIGSAKVFESLGYDAVATSSAALADTQGYEDGEEIPFSLLLDIAVRIKDQVSIPVSVDMERGFSESIDGLLANIEQLCKAGFSGINFEDSGFGNEQLQSPAVMRDKILAIRNFLKSINSDLFINLRTDAYIHDIPNPLEETLGRIKVYEQAGVDGIFVPYLYDKEAIATIVRSTKLPVNVLCGASLPDFETLSAIGVKRISMGSSLYKSLKKDMMFKLERVKKERSFKSFF